MSTSGFPGARRPGPRPHLLPYWADRLTFQIASALADGTGSGIIATPWRAPRTPGRTFDRHDDATEVSTSSACRTIGNPPCRTPNSSDETRRRRTFAIISHPDAGKTTIDREAAAVRRRHSARRHREGTQGGPVRDLGLDGARADSAGISVTSSVMQFPYRDRIVNLLDTPGHGDFSEDTYRTLTAVDSALMVIDGAKGVEERTIKLMDVCRLRDHPDHDLHQQARPGQPRPHRADGRGRDGAQDPVRAGHLADRQRADFKGVYTSIRRTRFICSARSTGVRSSAARPCEGLDNAGARRVASAFQATSCVESIELVRGASHEFDEQAYRKGRPSRPVFFGSALNNFGVEELLDEFVEWARPGAAASRPRTPGRWSRRRPAVLGLRVQDSGQHGPPAPRPDRLRAGGLRALSPGDEAVPRTHAGKRHAGPQRHHLPRAGAGAGRRRLSRRHHRVCRTTAPSRSATPSARARSSSSAASQLRTGAVPPRPCCATRCA